MKIIYEVLITSLIFKKKTELTEDSRIKLMYTKTLNNRGRTEIIGA